MRYSILAFLSLLWIYAPFAHGQIIYVDADANDANDGTSWANAYNYLQNALAAASSGDEIRVAQGVYKPDANNTDPNGSGDRRATFHLKNGVSIKGGYAGFGASEPNFREIKIYETILSGDLNGDDGPDFANNAENAYHVVTGSGVDVNTILDGFTIMGGNANSLNPDDCGGGMYNFNGHPTVRNCRFTGNRAQTGGGIYNTDSNSTVSNCIFTGNISIEDGGGMWNDTGNIVLNSCTFSGNSAGKDGGGMWNGYDAMLTNCTFAGNVAASYGGGIRNYGYAKFTNCILWNNKDQRGKDDRSQIYFSTDFICFCCIQDDDPNYSYLPFDPYDRTVYSDIIDDDPMFVCEPNDGSDGWGVGNNDDFGDLHLRFGSPCINAGHPFFSPEPNSVDIDGETRIFDGCVDIGADEFVAPIVVTKPKGGEVWAAGSTHEIKWNSYYVSDTVDIRLSINGGGSWTFIESGIFNTGSYKWLLPEMVDSNKCLVSVIPSVPDPNVFRLEGSLFTIKDFAPGLAVESKWESLGDNFERTGLSEHYGPEVGCVKWKFETDGPVSAGVTVGFDGRIHIPCEDGKLYTVDANGVLLWSYDANSALISSPTIGPDGTVYVGSESGKLYAVDVNGILRWTHTTGGPVYSSPAVSDDGEIYVCSQDGIVHALVQDGSEIWNYETGGPAQLQGSIFASPAIGADGTIYIAGLYDPNLYALEPNDGSVKWACSFEFPADPCDPNSEMKSGWPFASPVVAADGTIYQTFLYDSNLCAIEPNTGMIIWSVDLADPCSGWFEPYYFDLSQGERPPLNYQCITTDSPANLRCYNISDSILSEPALGPDGTIFVSFDDPYLRAVDPNGSIKWVVKLGTVGGFTLAVGNDSLNYAASDDANLYVVDSNGIGLSEFQTVYWLSFPVIAADNTLIISGINDYYIYLNSTIWAIKGYGCEDLNSDEIVNFFDFSLLAADWLNCTDTDYPCNYEGNEPHFLGDINKDGYVSLTDVEAMSGQWLEDFKWLKPPSPTPSPEQAINPNPLDGATDVSWGTILSWKAGLHATSHDVYFGTSSIPPFVCNQTSTIFYPSTMAPGITYYWRIDEVNMWGKTKGIVWSFTTIEGPIPPPM